MESKQLSIKELLKIYVNRPMLPYKKEKIRLTLLRLLAIHESSRKERSKRSVWVRPIFTSEQRFLQGDSNNLLEMLRTADEDLHFNYLRMSVSTFDELLILCGSEIEKQNVVREPISALTRLQICVRYLASGDSMRSVGYAFRVAPNTVSRVIEETCDKIYMQLKNKVLPLPTEDMWKNIAEDFEKIWQFPCCIGAIDGKHVQIEAPPHSGSTYFNYKKSHSINLTAVSGALYRFILVDVGSEGRRSDAGVFDNSRIKDGLEKNALNIPPAVELGGSKLPFVFVGDEAYPLSSYLMRPYSRNSSLTLKKKVFNYRLSRARRVVESAFGILVARWRIYRRPINTSIPKVEKIVLATICLHNFIISKELSKSPEERQYLQLPGDIQGPSQGPSQKNTQVGRQVLHKIANCYRERFAEYFFNEGAVEWQWDKASNNEF